MNSFIKILHGIREVFGQDEAAAFAVKAAGLKTEEDGGPGSGNWGHKGRPGKKGGSGKGGGSAMRSGSKESGYTSFTKSAEFGQISNLARRHYSRGSYSSKEGKRNFWIEVSTRPELDKAMRAQHKAACPDEPYSDYMDRMFEMLSGRVENERTAPSVEKILSEFKPGYKPLRNMTNEELKISKIMQRHGENPSDIVNNTFSTQDKVDFLETIGSRSKWSDRMLDRSFKNLSETEKADLNQLLDDHPWSSDPNQAKIPNEKAILDSEDPKVADYYCALKAKALGIGRVYVPDRPDSLSKQTD